MRKLLVWIIISLWEVSGFNPDDVITGAFYRPLLEIVQPENGDILESSDIKIIIAVSNYELPSSFRDSKVCLGLALQQNSLPDIMETCFAQSKTMEFYASGLIPGGTYLLRVVLADRGNVIAASIRSFQISLISLSDEMGRSYQLDIKSALDLALRHHRTGAKKAAEKIYRLIISENPFHAEALHLLGLVLYQNGQPSDAIPYIERAISSNSTFENFHNSLGECLRAIGQTRQAVSQFELALSIKKDFIEAEYNLGLAWQELNEWERAIRQFSNVITLAEIEEHAQAPSIKASKDFVVESQLRKCDLLQGLDQYMEARDCLIDAITKWPTQASFHHELANVYLQLGNIDMALASYETATQLGHESAELNVAVILELIGKYNESHARYKKVIDKAIQSGEPNIHIQIMAGTVLPRILPACSNESDRILNTFERNVDKLLTLVILYTDNTEPQVNSFSIGFYLAFYPESHSVIKTKLSTLYRRYCPALLTGDFLGEDNVMMKSDITAVTSKKSDVSPLGDGNSGRRIRIGFVSRFFYHHAIGRAFDGLIQALDKSEFEVLVFMILPGDLDYVGESIFSHADKVLTLPGKLRLCHQAILAEQIDILVYPEIGMDSISYFLSFARLAKTQAVWWGHPETSGVSNVDFFLSSQYEVEEAQKHYTEQLFRFNGMGLFQRMPKLEKDAPQPDEVREELSMRLGIPRASHFYVCADPLINLHPDFDRAIARILRLDHRGSIILLSTKQRGYWKERLQERFKGTIGLLSKRVHFLEDVPDRDVLSLLQAAHVVLDAVHCNGFVASLHAFAVGTPVVTLPGALWRTRITSSFYRQMDIEDCIASSLEEYAQIALSLAHNKELRAVVSAKILASRSKLFDNDSAVKEWERFFRYAAKQHVPQTAIRSAAEGDNVLR